MKTVFKSFLLPLIIATSTSTIASDLAKEQRWADQVVDAIIDGDAEWLNDGSNDFLGIYTEAEEDMKRGAIIMHGTGVHPDWQQVIQPLRVELTSAGWHTLSIQMPILPNEADYKEYIPLYPEVAPRIDAAVSFLKQQGIGKIVLIGHSQGATMGAYYLRKPSADIAAFAAIGMSGDFGSEVQDGIKSLKSITMPVLDLYGSDDLEGVLSTTTQRAAAAASTSLKQQRIDGANHYFDDKEAELVEAVSSWLDSLK